jgi:hypothetical protein
MTIMSHLQASLSCRRKEDDTQVGTTWQIKFKLDKVDRNSSYKLRVAIASATLAELQVMSLPILNIHLLHGAHGERMKGPVRPHPFLLEIYNAKIFFFYIFWWYLFRRFVLMMQKHNVHYLQAD